MATHTDRTPQHIDETPSEPTERHAGHDVSGHGEHDAPAGSGHEGHSKPAGGHESHGMGHGGHGDHVGMFRRRFWWSLLLTIPVVVTSHMVMDWLGYDLDFPGMFLVGPVLGSFIFLWAGWPFLTGGLARSAAVSPG